MDGERIPRDLEPIRVLRESIQRVSFAAPAGGIRFEEFSLVTKLCLGGGQDEGKMTTSLPDDTEIEIRIETRVRESE